MSSLEEFNEITRPDVPLAPLTGLKVGGSAQYFVTPRNEEELTRLVQHCHASEIPMHVLGGGSNLLVRDEGVQGVVIQLLPEGFNKVEVEGTTVRAGSAALLTRVISESVKAELAGLETLAGIPGTVGGALHGNAGTRSGDIGQFVQSVSVLTGKGERFTRTEDELSFAYRTSSVNELVILDAEFQLQKDDPAEISMRMRKIWIMKKATQPFSFQTAGCIFKNPRGMSAGSLIEQSGLKGTRIGGAEISDRHANFIVTHENATADDVLKLIDKSRSTVSEQFGVDLELEIEIW